MPFCGDTSYIQLQRLVSHILSYLVLLVTSENIEILESLMDSIMRQYICNIILYNLYGIHVQIHHVKMIFVFYHIWFHWKYEETDQLGKCSE